MVTNNEIMKLVNVIYPAGRNKLDGVNCFRFEKLTLRDTGVDNPPYRYLPTSTILGPFQRLPNII